MQRPAKSTKGTSASSFVGRRAGPASCPSGSLASKSSSWSIWGEREAALFIATMYFTHCRSGEVRRFCARDLLRHARQRGPFTHWAVTIAPQESDPLALQPLTKTDTLGDREILDSTPWLGDVFGQLKVLRKPDEALFSVSAPRLIYLFRQGHGSHQLAQHLPLPAASQRSERRSVKPRKGCGGRWRGDPSLRRYAKPAQVQRLLSTMTAARISFGDSAASHMEAFFRGRQSVSPLSTWIALLCRGTPVTHPLNGVHFVGMGV